MGERINELCEERNNHQNIRVLIGCINRIIEEETTCTSISKVGNGNLCEKAGKWRRVDTGRSKQPANKEKSLHQKKLIPRKYQEKLVDPRL